MNYQQAEHFVTSLVNIQRQEYMRQPRHCAVYLKRTQFFLDLLGNPEKQIPHYIHIAGTSGKGSVALMLQSILHEADIRVGCTTSPHPAQIQERWQVNQKDMSEQEFVKIVQEIKPKLDEYIKKSPYDMISYFELMTCISLYWFAKKKVEWAIVEAGCGGRYDSSNVIPYKDIAIITNIDLDHTDVLGNTKAKIAYEKAGIIKPKSKVFTMETDKKLVNILKREKNKSFTQVKGKIDYELNVLGEHQLKNASLCTAIASELGINDDVIKKGLQKTKLPLRLEIISKKPLIIIDSAHNPDKMKTTVETIKDLGKNIHLIVAFSANKDISKMVKQLASLKPKSVACTRYTINPFRKTANPKELQKKFKKLLPKTKIETFLNPKDASVWNKKTSDLILVTGSTFLAGEIRNL